MPVRRHSMYTWFNSIYTAGLEVILGSTSPVWERVVQSLDYSVKNMKVRLGLLSLHCPFASSNYPYLFSGCWIVYNWDPTEITRTILVQKMLSSWLPLKGMVTYFFHLSLLICNSCKKIWHGLGSYLEWRSGWWIKIRLVYFE